MTLVLTLGNADQVLIVADRRTTAGPRVVSEEHGKSGVFECLDARLAFAYSGIASVGTFSTEFWLLSALQDCGKPDHFAEATVERLRVRASRDFRDHPSLKCLPKSAKRLSVLFSGYLFRSDPPRVASAILTNFQDFGAGRDHDEAWDDFEVLYELEPRPSSGAFSHMQRIGFWPLLPPAVLAPLRVMLEQRAHSKAIVAATVDVF